MDSGALLKDLLDRNEGYVLPGFAKLTDAELRQRVTAGANPIGWLMWHMARVQDRAVAGMVGIDQRWIADGWHAKFGMGADPEQRGNGDSSDEVTAFAASAQVLVDYYAAVREQTNAFLDGLDADDPERQVPGFGAATVSLAQRVPGLILEAVQHGGQIAYVRGLVQGDGWQKKG
jgi:hypothetical protein